MVVGDVGNWDLKADTLAKEVKRPEDKFKELKVKP